MLARMGVVVGGYVSNVETVIIIKEDDKKCVKVN